MNVILAPVVKHLLWYTSFAPQDDKSRRRKKKAERSHKGSSSESSVDSEEEEVAFLHMIVEGKKTAGMIVFISFCTCYVTN